MKKKVGLLGGTFNPPHIGHLVIAEQVLNQSGLDEIRFLPNHVPPHKEVDVSVTVDQRIRMLEGAIRGNPRFAIERIELEREGPSYTYDTIKALQERDPEVEYSFIIGGDMIEYLPKWSRIDELIDMVRFIGVNRPEYSHETPYNVELVDVPDLKVSSSFIRKAVRDHRSIRYLVTDEVYRIIEEDGLYG
ncbi:nicotinate-nucleotide adenylyltransferase [Rossellomorea aquimaris]|uniref:nicotinate-nucleotide adenylyltransferase n=1 Tax=Rossellomorea aquimaris TaxID=189382 RepID=UPI001CD4197B|nr:nicotinate-nucleotide adenylyltransferase [Rossellomorea aquimaris]MCA1056218.1 nicotinate-nucleotide adenylyltransferase [Rossellomorea aquimaris]